MNALRDAALALFDAFKDIRKPKGVPSIWDIDSEALSAYQHHEFDHGSWVTEYLYFLPRTIHSGVIEDDYWFIPEVTGARINETDFKSWPTNRVEALKHFLTTLFYSLSTNADSGSVIDSWICAIVHMGLDIRPFLSQIEKSQDQILNYYATNADDLNHMRLSNPFWKSSQIECSQVLEWFGREDVSDVIEASYGIRLHKY